MYHDRINLTISALATSPGSSIGIIRISGPLGKNIALSLTGKKQFHHMKASLVSIYNETGSIIDKCLLLPFFSPHSFTGEDVIELHVHGSHCNATEILNLIYKLGAVPALCGEFSFRAVLNGKMSLNESLSLNSLITASNPESVRLSRKASFEDKLIDKIRLHLKTWEQYFILTTALIDFPDQINDELNYNDLKESCCNLGELLSGVVSNTLKYMKLLEFSILILGKPNVGKSTLFNALLNTNRAITSPIEGTTRDYITETLYIKGFPIKLIDSAGIRETISSIETEGVQKARNLISNSDLLLLVFDYSKPLNESDMQLLQETEHLSRILVFNKADIAEKSAQLFDNGSLVSSKTGEGLSNIFNFIETFISERLPDSNSTLFFSNWQTDTANKILQNIEVLHSLFESDQIELISSTIKSIYFDLMNLSGEISSFDIYDKIFGSFCLGK